MILDSTWATNTAEVAERVDDKVIEIEVHQVRKERHRHDELVGLVWQVDTALEKPEAPKIAHPLQTPL